MLVSKSVCSLPASKVAVLQLTSMKKKPQLVEIVNFFKQSALVFLLLFCITRFKQSIVNNTFCFILQASWTFPDSLCSLGFWILNSEVLLCVLKYSVIETLLWRLEWSQMNLPSSIVCLNDVSLGGSFSEEWSFLSWIHCRFFDF